VVSDGAVSMSAITAAIMKRRKRMRLTKMCFSWRFMRAAGRADSLRDTSAGSTVCAQLCDRCARPGPAEHLHAANSRQMICRCRVFTVDRVSRAVRALASLSIGADQHWIFQYYIYSGDVDGGLGIADPVAVGRDAWRTRPFF